MDKVILIQEQDITYLKPVTVTYFCENTGINRKTAGRWIEAKKILTDRKTGKVLFSEIIKFKK